MKQELEALIKIIEQQLDWGDNTTWQSGDFENLHDLILDKTSVSLSSSTLRRVWGRIDYNHDPSATTLNTLAQFAGFENWRNFLKERTGEPLVLQRENVGNEQKIVTPNFPGRSTILWFRILALTIAVIVVVLGLLVAFKKAPKPISTVSVAEFSFSSKPVTRGIPNSVIFTYDARAAVTDSVFIQQSWDSRTLTSVSKNEHQHTSIYYEPGFYQAKLMDGNKVVKEHPLLIPTNGWLGIIRNEPVPVYLDSSVFIYRDSLQVNVEEIKRNNIAVTPLPPVVKYFNVGNFEPVPVADFAFSAEVKNEFREGAAACQFMNIILITDDGPVFIPLSAKGCVSELNIYCLDHGVSGKNADLSAFGVDFNDWAHVVCKSSGNSIQFFINDMPAYESALPEKKINILGMSFLFQGTGAVKNINLQSKGLLKFQAF